jgi:hypothetical protein
LTEDVGKVLILLDLTLLSTQLRTGLGLSIVKKLCALLAIDIHISSQGCWDFVVLSF